MDTGRLRVVHYLNQFFGQEGQEDKAGMQFVVKDGPVGPGVALQKILGEKGEVIATIICGDNYFAENLDQAVGEGLELIRRYKPDLFFAGPAFESGRYGIACGAICRSVQGNLCIPALTGMAEENPGVDLYRRDVYICRTEKSTVKMVDCLIRMVDLAVKLRSYERGLKASSGEHPPKPEVNGYFARGMLKNELCERTGAERGIDMLLAKIQGRPFKTEIELPKRRVSQPAPPIKKHLADCEIALISDGGLVPKGNPDGLKGRGNLTWATYEIDGFLPENYSAFRYEVVHTGYFPVQVLENPNRLVPADVMRELARGGFIGKLHPLFYSTSGNATDPKICDEMGEEIAKQLKDKRVDGAILTST
jgi:glycine reductase